MKRVALILEGAVAKKFLETLASKYFSNNFYLVITKDASFLPSTLPSTFEAHVFDPTSAYRLHAVLDAKISDVFVMLDNPQEQHAIYEIIRQRNKDVRLLVNLPRADMWGGIKDDRLVIIDNTQILANKCIAKIPNVPSVPQGFGLEQGEVMEIGVPYGSVFAYRHIGALRQKDYKIVGIYRKNKFFLSHPSTIILPRDQLLVAGNPEVLNNVYLQVKSNVGQFPAPFGRDIYLYIDMRLQSPQALNRDLKQALFLHENLKSLALYVCVLNPKVGMIESIRAIEKPDIHVVLDFSGAPFMEKLYTDSQKKIGLVVVGPELFMHQENRKALFGITTPIFKTNTKGLEGIKKGMVVLNESMQQSEDISSVMFDICAQMGLDMLLYDFDPDKRYKVEVIDNYKHLSHIYSRKIKIIRTSMKNPILFLRKLEASIMQFLPFESCITQSQLFWMLSTKVEKIAFLSNTHPQIFIPVVE
ncbi:MULTISPECIES: COG3400 family protein [Helicobacter]|uniref:COG3400 family protein n=1 Tax=Helicobacter TaxID=209 RepID=UPI0019696CE9|nr:MULTISPECIES: TrkA C-terminal domain-containing protein [Helicobacter]